MLIILDRDGVINYDSEDYIKSPEEWIALPGSLEAIAEFNRAGHIVVVATNQSGIGRSYYTEQTLHAIHQKMEDELQKVGGSLKGIFYCAHHPDDNCECRKPKAGLLHQISKALSCNFDDAVMIGDSKRDIETAHAVGCRAILVRTGNGERTLSDGVCDKTVSVFDDLAAVTIVA